MTKYHLNEQQVVKGFYADSKMTSLVFYALCWYTLDLLQDETDLSDSENGRNYV